jgi:hypothetical protein
MSSTHPASYPVVRCKVDVPPPTSSTKEGNPKAQRQASRLAAVYLEKVGRGECAELADGGLAGGSIPLAISRPR